MEIREANVEDYDKLKIFYLKIYRENHPLQNKEFWIWQYGDVKYGRSFICIDDNKVVGHVGANFSGGLAWIINVYLEPDYRGKGILGKLYGLAREYYPLAATAANEAGLGLYRNMRWYRYHDLVRYVKINPEIVNPKIENVCKPINLEIDNFLIDSTHYFKQPTVKAIGLNGGTGINQSNVGGLRIVDIEDLNLLEEHAWELGYLWIDYITSWNDLKIKDLEKRKWIIDYKSCIPWRLNPVEENYFCDITFLSEEQLSKEFIVHRSFSDHGRVGSIL